VDYVVLALKEDPNALSYREGVLVIATVLLAVILSVWKLRHRFAKVVAISIGLAAGVLLFRHFTDVQTTVVLTENRLTVTKLHSSGWSVPRSQLMTLEVKRMRTKDELILMTTTGDSFVINVEGAVRRKDVAEAIGRYFELKESAPGKWVRPS
jgi:hypothetical protein